MWVIMSVINHDKRVIEILARYVGFSERSGFMCQQHFFIVALVLIILHLVEMLPCKNDFNFVRLGYWKIWRDF